MSIPEKYIPKVLTKNDKQKQTSYLNKSRRQYKKRSYYLRPKLKSFKNKTSKHLETVRSIYGINSIAANDELSKKTKCSMIGLEKIINKGRGAYYSSGSRPNQTPESWGVARLASAITGGPASTVDYHILNEHCKSGSMALKMANKTCRKAKKCKKYVRSKTIKNRRV